ncbi:SH3 domain-containing protein [bacterium]|nr:SH3 domain-containing protein [bacterium]
MNLNQTTLRARWSAAVALIVPVLLLAGIWLTGQAFSPTSVLAQETSGITSPASGSAVTESVTILGTATDANFQSYVLHYKPSDAFASAYAYFDDGSQPVVDGVLGVWDTSELAPGSYVLRLRVVRTDGNYDEYFVEDLQVGTSAQTPPQEPTAVITATAEATPTAEITATAEITPTIAPTEETTATAEASPVATVDVTATPTANVEATDSPGTAQILTARAINVRGGPGTNYPVVAALQAGESAPIVGRNETGDWWQIQVGDTQGWVLSTIVTAENADNVPVVATPPAPAATATPVPAATSTAPQGSAAVTETESVTTASPVEVSVTLTGNITDATALADFVRTLLAGFGADDAAVAATIGSLPTDFPIDITVPTTATVIGGVTRSGDFGGNQLFLSTVDGADGIVAALRTQLTNAGYTLAAEDSMRSPSEVFLSSSPLGAPLMFCGPNDDLVVNISTLVLTGEADLVVMNANTISAFGGPCGEDGVSTGESPFDVLPSLTPPAEAQVFGRGTGSSSGTDGYSISAEAEIETAQPVSALADHYETQLEEAGWERVRDSATEDLSWSAWTFSSDVAEWEATFYIVRRGSEAGAFLATLHAQTE